MTDLFTTPPSEDKDYLAELVGEGKKYKDAQALAKSVAFREAHVQQIERSNDELRADYLALLDKDKTRESLEALLDQQKQQLMSKPQEPKVVEKAFDPQVLESLVSNKIREHEETKSQSQNLQFVMDKVRERYGNDYRESLQAQIESLGMTQELVNSMAKTSPKALLKTLGLEDFPRTDPFQAPPRSSVFQPTSGTKKRTWSYYQDLKKSDPKAYYNPKTSVQMEKDYASLGAEFEDGDFRRYGDSAFA